MNSHPVAGLETNEELGEIGGRLGVGAKAKSGASV